ncbi:MAG: phosphatase PAP2 family protein [Bacteroidota bacterium]
MIENILNFDRFIFYFLNNDLSLPFLDNFFVTLTELNKIKFIQISLICLLLFIFTAGKKKSKITTLFLILTLIITDQVSSQFLKHFFERVRPCFETENIRLLVPCGGGFSFPSSHATNAFAFVTLFSKFYKNYKTHYLVFGFLIAYSRIYVGVHYPLDILAGAIVGFVISYFILFCIKKSLPKIFEDVTA